MPTPWSCLAVASLVIVAFESCSHSNSPDLRPNVLVITLDTVRADRLGCYGYSPARTPNLDALAARGVRFERAYSHVPFTLPSHSTLMTGLYPNGHGLHINFQGSISAESTPLAEIFAKQGYSTAAFVATSVLDHRFGLARGFGLYDDLRNRPLDANVQVERPGGEITQSAVAWLERRPPSPFFAWVHYYDAHDPYVPPAGFRDFAKPYDGEIAFVDSEVGKLVAALDRLGMSSNTYIVVVADHGEAFGEHGEEGHGLFIYDTTMHVPMIMAGPAPIQPGVVFRDPVGLVDVHPTLLALLDFPATKGLDGTSLVQALRGERVVSHPLQMESENSLRAYGWAPLYGLIAGKWKYVQAPEEELYDLPQDPSEARNRCSSDSNACTSLALELTRLRASSTRREAGEVHLGLDARNALSKLGYVEGEAVGDPSAISGLADPKAMAQVAVGATRARVLLRTGQDEAALALVRTLVEASPQSGHLWLIKGSAELNLKLPLDAIQSFENSLKSFPASAERLRALGDALLAVGRMDDALARYKEAVAADPLDGQNESRLGVFNARVGKFDDALKHFQRFAELEPNSPNAHTNLANALFSKARFEEGIEHLKRAVWLDSRCAPAYRALYSIRLQRHERAAALEVLREATAALPLDLYFRSQIAWVLSTTGTSGTDALIEAMQLARACVQAAPQDPAFLDVLGAALARHGEFAEAIDVAGQASSRAKASGNAALAGAIEQRLALYRKGQPYVETD